MENKKYPFEIEYVDFSKHPNLSHPIRVSNPVFTNLTQDEKEQAITDWMKDYPYAMTDRAVKYLASAIKCGGKFLYFGINCDKPLIWAYGTDKRQCLEYFLRKVYGEELDDSIRDLFQINPNGKNRDGKPEDLDNEIFNI